MHGPLFAQEAGSAIETEAADPSPDWKNDTLTGDWGGIRAQWFKKGIHLGLSHKSDVLADVSGGIKQGAAWMGNSNVRLAVDFDKLAGWSGTTAFIHFHSNLGSKFNTHYAGTFMGEDNIEVATNTAQFFQAWIQKSFVHDRFSMLVGLYAVDSEFYATDTSGVFLQPAYGMANDLGQTGVNGPPIFPQGALGARVKAITPGGDFYLQGAVTDGVPGDPDRPHGTHIKLGHGDGTFNILELGYTPQAEAKPGETKTEALHKTAFGLWRYTAKFDDLESMDIHGNPKRRHSQGAYFLSEHTLYTDTAHPARHLSGFVRFGAASENVQQADWSGSLGLNCRGLIPGRDEDIAGLALTVNHAGDKYRRLNHADSSEANWELTYRAKVNGWLAVQPDVQYIVNPNMDKAIDDAWVVGARVEIEL